MSIHDNRLEAEAFLKFLDAITSDQRLPMANSFLRSYYDDKSVGLPTHDVSAVAELRNIVGKITREVVLSELSRGVSCEDIAKSLDMPVIDVNGIRAFRDRITAGPG